MCVSLYDLQEEMRLSGLTSADYLKALPPAYEVGFPRNEVLRNEWERMSHQKKMKKTTNRLAAGSEDGEPTMEQPPLAKRNDLQAWEESIKRGQAALEHRSLRNLNLELMVKYVESG